MVKMLSLRVQYLMPPVTWQELIEGKGYHLLSYCFLKLQDSLQQYVLPIIFKLMEVNAALKNNKNKTMYFFNELIGLSFRFAYSCNFLFNLKDMTKNTYLLLGFLELLPGCTKEHLD